MLRGFFLFLILALGSSVYAGDQVLVDDTIFYTVSQKGLNIACMTINKRMEELSIDDMGLYWFRCGLYNETEEPITFIRHELRYCQGENRSTFKDYRGDWFKEALTVPPGSYKEYFDLVTEYATTKKAMILIYGDDFIALPISKTAGLENTGSMRGNMADSYGKELPLICEGYPVPDFSSP